MSGNLIVVGIDGTLASTRAATVAWHLARALDVPCRLIHVVSDSWAALVGAQTSDLPEARDAIVRDARERMTEALSATLPPAAVATLEVRIGKPEDVLAQAAADAQLLVVGGRRHAALARGMGGSTAHDLVRLVDTPVLVLERDAWPIRRVLVAVDLSFAAAPTLDVARWLARATGAHLRVLHVVEPVRATRPTARVDTSLYEEAAVEEFARLTAGLPDVRAGDRVIRHGVAAAVIVRESEAWQPDVIVLGSHGKGWVERLMLGSVTERLLAMHPTSVLVVPVHPARASSHGRRTDHAGKGTTIIF